LTNVTDDVPVTTTTLERHISLEIAFNVRHLGGYSAANGRRTTARVIRAASLHRLTPKSVAHLAANGLKTIVDFRSTAEVERDRTPDMNEHRVRNINVPVFESDAAPSALGDNFPGFGAVYERFLDQGGTAYRTLAQSVLDAEGAVLFHCAAGKDRTGVGAMLLLELAGVAESDIVADYAESADRLESERPVWIERMTERGMSPELSEKLLGSHPEAMEFTLDVLRHRWGSAAGYLRAQGMSGQRIEQLQERLVE
jgi:protein-tyrosine phosphatase